MSFQRKTILLGAGLLMAGLLASCVTEDEKVNADAQAICLETGGKWAPSIVPDIFQCYPQYKDGGKSCSKASDCEGMCQAETRTCESTFRYGCVSHLDQDGKEATICYE